MKICINLYALRLGNDLLDMISETQATKKINLGSQYQLDFIKIKTVFSKNIIKNGKKKTINRRKISANHLSD